MSAKKFLDQKCLAQSNLKVEHDCKFASVDPPPVSPTVKHGVSTQDSKVSEIYLNFILEIRENQRNFLRKLDEIIEEKKEASLVHFRSFG